MARYTDQIDTQAGRKVTYLGLGANIFLIILKFTVGTLGRSQALIADAIHSVSDLFTDVVVLFGLAVGRKAPDESHPFGHARIETLASSVIGLALIAVAIFLGFDSANNIYLHTEQHPAPVTLVAAALSVIIKEAVFQYTVRVGRAIKSPAVMANAWHHRSDALSSGAVLVGLAGTQISPDWHVLDAYAALIVSVLIFKVGLDTLWTTLKEVTDTAPALEELEKIKKCALSIHGVSNVHDLKVRTSGTLLLLEIHIGVDGGLRVLEGHKIAKEAETCIVDEIDNVGQIIVHVDPV